MVTANKTASWECRFLDDSYFDVLFEVFNKAFSDYDLHVYLTEQQFRNHLALNSVDLRDSVGVFVDGTLSGFTLNGSGDWRGMPTVYDAGTGVLPEFRRRGIGLYMFEEMMPIFIARGMKQVLLEVIQTNHRAIGLYLKLGFTTVRELSLLEEVNGLNFDHPNQDVVIGSAFEPDWEVFSTFWDGEPSWQNTIDAMERSRSNKELLTARIDGRIVGYVIFSTKVGRVAQIAVSREMRRKGIGTRILLEMAKRTDDGRRMSIINVDTQLEDDIKFFNNRGFIEKMRQFEMVRQL